MLLFSPKATQIFILNIWMKLFFEVMKRYFEASKFMEMKRGAVIYINNNSFCNRYKNVTRRLNTQIIKKIYFV